MFMSTSHEHEAGQFTRRAFLKGAALTTVAAGAVVAGCSPAAGGDAAAPAAGGDGAPKAGTNFTTYANPDKIGIVQETSNEETYDFVVVGSGVTGLTATMIAAEQAPDAKIALIEKFNITGGNGNFAEINAGAPPTTPEAAHKRAVETAAASTYIRDAVLLESLWTDASKNAAWLFQKHGVEHDPTNLYYKNREGAEWMALLTSQINTEETYENVTVLLNTQATALLLQDEHHITGIQIRDNSSGEYTNINAKAVLLATGGMGTNLDLLSYYTGEDVQEKCIGIGVGQDGDGHLLAEQTAHGASKGVYPTGMFHNVKGFGFTSPLGVAVALQPTNLYINQRGERYVDESAVNKYPYIPAGKAIEQQGKAFSIFGQNLIKYFEENGSQTGQWYYYHIPTSLQEDLATYANNEYVFKADTIEALAEAIEVPVDALKKTFDGYEAAAAAGEADADLGKPAEFMIPLGDAPYYAFRVFSGVCQTNGGVRIDEFCRVVDPYFTPIEGLFAGGITVSGFNGEVYSPGTSQAVASWSGSKVARYVVENVLGGTVADNWYGDDDYLGGGPNMEGADLGKPILDHGGAA
jgi:fumarate reductase flavoprotein subunit